MATKITVDGTTITINNKSKSSESAFDLDDELDLRAQAAEAFAISETLCKAYESTSAIMSTEAANNKGGFFKKIGAGLKKVWEAIKNFFIRIGKFIKNWISSKILRVRAAAVYKKLKENGVKDNWREIPISNCPSIKKALQLMKDNANASSKLMSATMKIANADIDESYMEVFNTAINNMKQFASTKVEKSTVGNIVFDPKTEIILPIGGIAAFNSEIINFIKLADKCADKMVQICEKFADKSSDERQFMNDVAGGDIGKEGQAGLNKAVKLARLVQKYCNDSVSQYITIANSIVKIGSLIASDGAKAAKQFVKEQQKVKPTK